MKTGPGFIPPPLALVQSIEARAPGFFRRFAGALDSALEDVEVTATSWFRSATRNAAVGGAVASQHRWGCAVDLVLAPGDKPRAVQRLKAAGFWVVDEGDHVHVQAFPTSKALRAIAPG